MRATFAALFVLVGCGGSPCPEYSGIDEVGQYWKWQHTGAFTEANGGVTGEWEVELVTFEKDDATDAWNAKFHTVGVAHAPDLDDTNYEVDVDLVCDADGLWVASEVWSGDVATPFGMFPVVLKKTFEALDHVLIVEPAAGATWISSNSGTTEDPQNGEQAFTESVTRTLGQPTTITVPAGTFEVLPMETVIDDGDPITSYADAEIGMVSDSIGELVEYGVRE